MLILFRSGPVVDNTSNTFDEFDVIDVIPRHKESVIRDRGLGKKDTSLFWVEVNTDNISDYAWNQLAQRIAAPDMEEVRVLPVHPVKKPAPPVYKVKRKRKMKLNGEELEKLDKSFKVGIAKADKDAKKIRPKKRLTIKQLNKIISDKKTGLNLDGS